MSAQNIGPSIGLYGVDQYKQDLDSARAATKAFKAELEGAAKIKDPFSSAQASSAALGKEISSQQIYIKGLTEKYAEAVSQYGAYSKEAFDAQKNLANANKALAAMMQQYEKISTAKITVPGVGEFKRDLETLTQSTKTFKAEFQAISSGFGISGSFQRAAESSNSLRNSISLQKETIKLLQEDYQKAVKEQGEFSEGAMAMREKIASATTELHNMEKTLRDLPNGLTTAGQEMKELGNKWKQAGSEFTNAAKPFNAYTAAYTAGVAGIAKVSIDYERQMSVVQAVTNNTADEMAKMNDELLKIARDSIYTPQQLAEGIEQLARAGIKDTNDQLSVLNASLNLGTAEGAEFSSMADGLISTLYQFGKDMSYAGEASDILAQASRSAKTNVGLLYETFAQAAPSMHALGFTLQDTAFAADLMADAGLAGSKAGTYLKSSMANLTSPTDKQAAAMEKYGISLDAGNGKSVTFVGLLTQMRDAFGGLDVDMSLLNGDLEDEEALWTQLSGSLPTEQLEKMQGVVDIFGKRSLPAMLAMINATPERFEELIQAFEDTTGVAEEMANTVEESTGAQWQKLLTDIQALAIEFGQSLLPVIRDVLEVAKGWVDRFRDMDDGTKKFILTAGGIMALVGPILTGIGGITSGIGGIMSTGGSLMSGIGQLGSLIGIGGAAGAGGGLIGGIASLGSGFIGLLPTIGPIIGVIAALVAVGVLLYKNWDTIKEYGAQLWEGLKYGWETGVQSLKDLANGLKESVVEKFTALKNGVTAVAEGTKSLLSEKWNTIKTNAVNTWDSIKQSVTDKVNTIKQGVSDKWNAIKTTTTNAFDTVKNKITGAFDAAKTAAQNALSSITQIGSDIKNSISSTINDALNWGKDLVGNIASGIRQKISDVVDAASNVASTIRSYLHFSVPDKGPLADADKYMPDFMKLLASGLRSGAGMLNAASDHLARNIMPDFYADLPAGGGNTTNMGGVNIVINAQPGQDVEELAEAVEHRISNLIVRREAAYA